MYGLWTYFMHHSLRINIESHHSEHKELDEFKSTAETSHLCCLMSSAVTSLQTSFARLVKETSFLTWLPVPLHCLSDNIHSILPTAQCITNPGAEMSLLGFPLKNVRSALFLSKPLPWTSWHLCKPHNTEEPRFQELIPLLGHTNCNLNASYEAKINNTCNWMSLGWKNCTIKTVKEKAGIKQVK